MESYILRENVLSDDILLLADDKKHFKGGYCAIIKENNFQSAWTDKETVRKFKSRREMQKYITKKYPEFNYYN